MSSVKLHGIKPGFLRPPGSLRKCLCKFMDLVSGQFFGDHPGFYIGDGRGRDYHLFAGGKPLLPPRM